MRLLRLKPTQKGEEGINRGISHVVLVLGLVLTALVALLEQSNAQNQKEIMFDAAAAHVQEDLVNSVDSRIQEFQTGINFIAATHPGPLDQYQDFFTREVMAVMDNDPGVLFLEFIPTDDSDKLIERERRLGNNDFELTLLPSTSQERVILTRLARDATVFELPLLGLDVTALQKQLLPERVGPNGFELFIVPSADLTAFVSSGDLWDERYGDYENHTAFLIGAVTDEEGTLLGYSVYFQTVNGLLENVTDQDLDNLSVELFVEGIDEPIAGLQSPDAPALDAAAQRASREVTTTSLRWRIDVWADDGFGPSTGLFDQVWVWIIGTLVTVAAYAASIRRQRNRLHLDNARFELAHARTLAQTDALTGLLNRNGLVEAARQIPEDGAATVFFIDLDGFKAVNDSGGHDLGDQVLRSVAAELRSIFRTDDLVSRMGGDEFVVFTMRAGTSDYIKTISARDQQGDLQHRRACHVLPRRRITGRRTIGRCEGPGAGR